jgi:hypothetical protein
MRNLETWLYWLEARRTGRDWTINETEDYKTNRPPGISNIETDGFCKSAGTYLHSLNHLSMPPNCPPMLADALCQFRAFVGSF